jgi:ribosomal protein L40E
LTWRRKRQIVAAMDNRSQCQQCGARLDDDDLECRSCGTKTQRGQDAKQQLDQEPWQAKVQRLEDRELARPPRRVPTAHAIAAFSPLWTSVFAAVVIISSYFARLAESHAGAGALIGVPLVLFLAMVVRGARRNALLRDGIASRAELVEARASGSLEASGIKYSDGWDVQVSGYQGAAYRNVLRLWGMGGKNATFTDNFPLGGFPYEGEIYLLDPNRPSRHIGVRSFSIPLRPDASGQWRVWPEAKKRLAVRIVIGILCLAAAGTAIWFDSTTRASAEPASQAAELE